MTPLERIEHLEADVAILKIDRDVCKVNFEKLTQIVADVISIMTPSLNELAKLTSALDNVYDNEFALSAEELRELGIKHHNAAIRVARKYAEAVMAAVDYQRGRV